MYTLFVILIVIAAILMIGIVLIQESKGVFARQPTSLRKPHGDLLSPWYSSVLYVLG